ncbi:VUT family protein [Phytohabitans kaempferiae]|uniref:VUT family protein n=1 Tax=Phytohabitans kaempferiae TaxID=1620943 RepID=A0ABV6MC88_9ACTN
MAAFAVAVIAANWLTSTFRLVPVGFGLTATAGTIAAGFTLLARDVVHDLAGRRAVLVCIPVGAGLSAATAGPHLAFASAAAFAVAELADLLVYQPLRQRGFLRAVLASNMIGAPLDSIVFLTHAGLPVWSALASQMWVKTVATIVPVAAVLAARALLRHRLRPARREAIRVGRLGLIATPAGGSPPGPASTGSPTTPATPATIPATTGTAPGWAATPPTPNGAGSPPPPTLSATPPPRWPGPRRCSPASATPATQSPW